LERIDKIKNLFAEPFYTYRYKTLNNRTMSSEISSHEGRLNAVALTALHLAQQDVYYDQIIDPSNPAYNIGGYIRLKGQLNNNCFFQAISQLPEAFDLFRMRFHFSDAIPQCSFDNPPLPSHFC